MAAKMALIRQVGSITSTKDFDPKKHFSEVPDSMYDELIVCALIASRTEEIFNSVVSYVVGTQKNQLGLIAKTLKKVSKNLFVARFPGGGSKHGSTFLTNMNEFTNIITRTIEIQEESTKRKESALLKEMAMFFLTEQSEKAIHYSKAMCKSVSNLLKRTRMFINITPLELENSAWPCRVLQSDRSNWPDDIFVTLIEPLKGRIFGHGKSLFNEDAPITYLIRQEIFQYDNRDLMDLVFFSGSSRVAIEPYLRRIYDSFHDQGKDKENKTFMAMCTSSNEFATFACVQIDLCARTSLRDPTVIALTKASNIEDIKAALERVSSRTTSITRFARSLRVVFGNKEYTNIKNGTEMEVGSSSEDESQMSE